MPAIKEGTQVSFKTDPTLLRKAKKVLADNGTDMTKTLNLFLQNVVERKEIPLMTEDELRRERLINQLQTEVAESIAEYKAGRSIPLEEVAKRYGIEDL
ncbi:type II toxin-antitoxin system RelB/ParD family antitoxin [Streptococcus downei]|uniref:DNA-damage-inducible protein J n=1 Tax=Streptococcus downei MFe28 TaxID=764290 RepID=A0A380JIL7_STRDO|nr:toxin-antitoxin system antitoxin subunit [Streptococcus downei]EFQ58170.1 putative toxin-antitoxin system, antitoxin component, ribbon-helix-helix domain protein [Streptococcus downei F0415]SUN37226.1 DNA-damage-inducible protein J [Streptococcus downei MFe28]